MDDIINKPTSALPKTLGADECPKPDPAKVSELIGYWNIQENLFQGYRRLYLTFEAILLSLGSIVVSRIHGDGNIKQLIFEIILLFTTSITAILIHLWMRPIISKRGELVFFYQAMLLKAERGEKIYGPLNKMKEFQENPNSEFRKDNDFRRLHTGPHKARNLLQRGIPLAIFFAWIGVFIAFVIKWLPSKWIQTILRGNL